MKYLVNDLSVFYDDKQALKNINMDIPERSITAFIGPSGCGKSTFLRSLNRMNDLIEGAKTTGSIKLDGEEILSRDIDPTALRSRVGMVFQKANPFPMSVYDNVAYGLKVAGMKKRSEITERVEQALDEAALLDEVRDRLHDSALGLSGGQQQRLCIARALAVRPDVVLMDESTSALDPLSTARIEELAAELKKKYTVIMVTHNMQQAARISDQCAFFLMGDLVEYGKTDQIFNNPHDPRTEGYITGRFG